MVIERLIKDNLNVGVLSVCQALWLDFDGLRSTHCGHSGFSKADLNDRVQRRCFCASRWNGELCPNFYVLDATDWRGNRYAVFAHAIKVKLNGFANLRRNFAYCGTRGDASRKIRNVRRKISLCFFYHDSVTHMFLIS